MKFCDVFIIGGGPAGSIAAAKLVQSGLTVKLVERQVFPRFVIGESLLPRCNQLLAEANLLDAIQQANFQVKGGVAFETKQNFEIFHFENNLGEPFNSSFQVKRETFDHELLKEAERMGTDVEFESEVIAYDAEKNIVTVKTKTGDIKTYQAKKVIDASGYGRVLPRLLNLEAKPKLALRRATFCRVKHDIRPTDGTEGYIYVDIHGNNDAWIWNIPFNDGITSVGIVCTEEYFQSFNMTDTEFWDYIIATNSSAQKRYVNATKVNEVGSLSGYSAAVKKLSGNHFVLVGNASEFLDPVFSSGVTLALESGALAADLTLKELQGNKVDWQTEYEDYMMRGINVFREFVESWYDGRLQTIFFTEEKDEKIKQAITSVLSGYVWNEKNFFVKNPAQAVSTLVAMIEAR
ncbi:NAD(P)/FAD-dependent oxidoreductase [Hydrogenovibrio sp. 3SP14C1]|uniref:NAD(P)/FAD-dependent oxidoreductase n=1 Tax=Hydrogenovibrio sp. 3SP14C1 TaxID=3038774 RepID=UPI0024177296|nr:NAD(P)/FAD-dependent oxidoreductase [Hydrogenovibrio sp. 3SP14C1]MDG4811614.1 NAD(P)/FAD-dependent oxidoreductase [Hydrogenovibrio sp. 3SP14C1]